MDKISEKIKAARIAKGVTIEEVAEATLLSVNIIKDIEDGAFERFVGDELYVKMYLKKIARYLEIDETIADDYYAITREIKKADLKDLENKKEDIGSVTFVDKVKNIQKTVSVTPIIHDSYPFLKAQGLLIKFIKTNDTDWQTNSEEKYTYEFNEFGDWITRITHKKNKNGDYTISGGTYREFLSLEDIKTNNN